MESVKVNTIMFLFTLPVNNAKNLLTAIIFQSHLLSHIPYKSQCHLFSLCFEQNWVIPFDQVILQFMHVSYNSSDYSTMRKCIHCL